MGGEECLTAGCAQFLLHVCCNLVVVIYASYRGIIHSVYQTQKFTIAKAGHGLHINRYLVYLCVRGGYISFRKARDKSAGIREPGV